MRILVTGASGWLGNTLVPRLTAAGHQVFGLDPQPSQWTQIVGSVADAALVRDAVLDNRIQAIVHAGALHKPNIGAYSRADFVAVNVQGTLNLLEAATAPGSAVDRFVFTSTTSLMISQAIRDGATGGATCAAWIDEDLAPLQPRNIYGVTKYAAEHLCRLVHAESGLPVVILRTGRFFPEEDDMAHAIAQSEPNTKANEFLFRRLTVEDAAEAHVVALEKAPALGFDRFILCAQTPFRPEDCADLIDNAPAVVERYFPTYPELYARRGWTMFQSIDRVYDASRAARRLGFVCRTGFAEVLAGLAAEG